MSDLIRTNEAAAMLKMRTQSFRRLFCSHQNPRLPIVEFWGQSGYRRILVRRSDVEALIESMTLRPAQVRPERGAPVLIQKRPQKPPEGQS